MPAAHLLSNKDMEPLAPSPACRAPPPLGSCKEVIILPLRLQICCLRHHLGKHEGAEPGEMGQNKRRERGKGERKEFRLDAKLPDPARRCCTASGAHRIAESATSIPDAKHATIAVPPFTVITRKVTAHPAANRAVLWVCPQPQEFPCSWPCKASTVAGGQAHIYAGLCLAMERFITRVLAAAALLRVKTN